jgi:hypothetical protein
LKLKPKKLFKKEVEFLGKLVTSEGIKISPSKAEAVKAMPSDEGRFLTVTILQLNLVIPAGKIQGTERCHPLQRVETILNNGQRVRKRPSSLGMASLNILEWAWGCATPRPLSKSYAVYATWFDLDRTSRLPG